jgi:hypothetical protein
VRDLARLPGNPAAAQFIRLEQRQVAPAQPTGTLDRIHRPDSLGADDEPILVKRKDGSSELMDEMSPIHPDPDLVRHPHVFCPEGKKDAVIEAAINRFGPLPTGIPK